MADLALIEPTDTKPIYMAHGSSDATVPFTSGPPFSFGTFPTVFGSQLINSTLDGNGFTDKETFFVTDEGHEFYGTSNGTWQNGVGGNMYWELMLPDIANFLWLQHKPDGDFDYTTDDLNVDFNDLTPGASDWYWEFGDGNTSIQENPSHSYADDGTYEVHLFVQNNILSCDEVIKQVTVLAPLPLTWVSPLTAEYKAKKVDLNWIVAEQINNDYFVIEHSMNGRDFVSLGKVEGLENALEEMAYSYIHDRPILGINYYRVKQVDFDGRFTYSTVASVDVADLDNAFSIQPNPADESITLRHQSALETAWVDLFNMQGVLQKSALVADEGQMNLEELPRGMYIVKVRGTSIVQKLILK